MPIKIPDNLPAAKILDAENVFIMSEQRATHQDIRPLKIVILNLMPTKEETETQLLRLLGNSPLQVDVTLLQAVTHISKNTPAEYLKTFYHTFEEIRDEKYDGMIITGAPVEVMRFEDVDYWQELCGIMEWTRSHVYSTVHICWGAQAGLYYHHHIPKYPLPEKLSGIFRHRVLEPTHPLMRGFDELFYMPHSRYTEVRQEDIEKAPGLTVLALSETAGVAIVATDDSRQLFVTGHCEYDRYTLAKEYQRDVQRGLDPAVPQHYFPGDNPEAVPPLIWRAHAHLLIGNWLNYCVYQPTPYNLGDLQRK